MTYEQVFFILLTRFLYNNTIKEFAFYSTHKKARSARISHSHSSLLRSGKLSGHTNLFLLYRKRAVSCKVKKMITLI